MTPTRATSSRIQLRQAAAGLIAIAALTALGAASARALVSGTFFVPPGLERVAWLLPGVTGDRQSQIAQVGPWARTDYARFAGPGGQGEILFKTANYGRYVLHHPPGLRRLAESWNHLRGRIRGWHRGDLVRSYLATTGLRRATLDDGTSCVVFSGEGQAVTYDPQARPGLVYFGYFCAPRGGVLDAAAARRIVSALRLSYDRRPPALDRGPSAEARAIAEGSLRSRTGNARFPFPLATPYIDVGRGFERP